MPKLLIIVGPTASGKSALAVQLARKFGGEIISADSRQVYKGLDIGTGKITKREMRGVPHHLLDVASPKRKFSVDKFVKLANKKYSHIHHRGTSIVSKGSSPKKNWSLKNMRVSVMVGGTGYYIDAFVGRLTVPEVAVDARLRSKLEKKSVEELFAILQKKDPARAEAMSTPSERNNKRRLIRALEIATALGAVPKKRSEDLYDTLWIGLNSPLKILEQKIHKRLLARIRGGMIAEAIRLRKGGLSFKRMEELGLEYRSLARFLQKKISREEMIAELDRDIRRYAKKQLMYWKRNKEIQWFDPRQKSVIVKTVREWLLRRSHI